MQAGTEASICHTIYSLNVAERYQSIAPRLKICMQYKKQFADAVYMQLAV